MKKVGILLPIFSLPNKYGIGTLGKEAYAFVDFLKESKQNLWQLLPTNPTSYGDSPYQSFSCFAQNQYFIDLELLVEDGLLTKDDLDNSYLVNNTRYIDYGCLFVNKNNILAKTYKNHKLFQKEFNKFKKENKYWLDDYALFMSLKKSHNYNCWDTWEDEYKFRNKEALTLYKRKYRKDIDTVKFIQFLYYRQYKALLKYAHKQGIKIVGDIPIYCAYDSVDVWSEPTNFKLDQWLKPTDVAGVPPDYFSATGQLWGNPVYNWDKMKTNKYKWWVNRIKYQLTQTDYVRIDHFRGFSAYYEIPYGSENAINGKWVKGPSKELFDTIKKKLNNTRIIAENLGLLDDDVYDLINYTKYPGMHIFQFEVYSKDAIIKLNKESSNNVFYPGTHDNKPFVGWLNEDASYDEKENIKELLKLNDNSNIAFNLIQYCYQTKFKYVILSMQDILGLGSEARINFPGNTGNYWQYRFESEDFSSQLTAKLQEYVIKYTK